MKKLLQILAATVLSVGFISSLSSANAHAVTNCNNLVIVNTGQGSSNVVICADTLDLEATCTNNAYVLTTNSQQAVSGEAAAQNNGTGGSAVSGNATNENGTSVAIGASCGEQETPITPTTSTTPTPTTPTVSTPSAQKVSALPFTAGNSMIETILVASIIVVTALASIRFAVVAYRRLAVK